MRVDVAPDAASRFPGLAVAWSAVDGLDVKGAGAPEAAALQSAATEHVRRTRTLDGLKDDPLFRAYRDFYWSVGVDPTKTRPSGEALNRRVLAGNALPSINAFVDAYNAASLGTGVSIGAYDRDRVAGDALALRLAAPGEPFRGIGEAEPRALAGGEVVLADAARIVNRYPYRDAEETKITTTTRRAVLVACSVPGLPFDAVREAATLATVNVQRACGGVAVEVGP